MIRLAGITLHYANGDVVLQHRDDSPSIAFPNQWALFGGHIEAGETPFEAAVREVEEELTITLDPARVHPVGVFYHEPGKEIHVFHYLVTDELDRAVLTEGQAFGRIPIHTALSGRIGDHRVIPHHCAILDWFVNVHQTMRSVDDGFTDRLADRHGRAGLLENRDEPTIGERENV